MKIRSTLLLLALLAPAAILRAESGGALEFTGLLVDGSRTRVGLIDLGSGTAGWVRIGGNFLGYTVASYDPAKQTVTLTREGWPALAIRLKDAVILLAPPTPPWVQPSNEQRAAVADNLRRLAAAAAQFYATTGVDTATLDDLVGPGKPLEQLTPATGESYAGLVLSRDTPTLSVTTSDGTSISSDGTSIAADGSRITPDGGRITTDGTRYAPDGSLVLNDPANDSLEGPFIPPNATHRFAAALLAVGWKYEPAAPVGP